MRKEVLMKKGFVDFAVKVMWEENHIKTVISMYLIARRILKESYRNGEISLMMYRYFIGKLKSVLVERNLNSSVCTVYFGNKPSRRYRRNVKIERGMWYEE